MTAFQSHIKTTEPKAPVEQELSISFPCNILAGGIAAHPPYPGKFLPDTMQQGYQGLMGQSQCVSVGKKQSGLSTTPGRGKIEIFLDMFPGFDLKDTVPVGSTKSTAVM